MDAPVATRAGSHHARRFASADSRVRYRFSGHQTFPFRYGWLPKGVAAVANDSAAFSRPDALVRLGVGKNMVASIRHWCEAVGLIEGIGRGYAPSMMGCLLFGSPPPPPPHWEDAGPPDALWPCEETLHLIQEFLPEGADPYVEDPGTLWLLHWKLVSHPAPASTWHLAFTCWSQGAFSRDGLEAWLLRVAHENGSRRTSAASIERDVDVFLRTYLPSRTRGRRSFEDSLDCPLSELGLIRRVDDRFAIDRESRPHLPNGVFAFALAEFWRRNIDLQETLSLERILYGAGSPGAAFRLGDRDLVSILDRLPEETGFRYDETAGSRLVIRETRREPLALLAAHYAGAEE